VGGGNPFGEGFNPFGGGGQGNPFGGFSYSWSSGQGGGPDVNFEDPFDLFNQIFGMGGFFNTSSYLFGSITNLILVAVITFYLSIEPHGVEYVLRVITPQKHETYVISLWKRTERKIGLWLQGQILVGLIVGLITYLGLVLLGIKYALLLAFVAAVFVIIPFGIILAGLCAVVFAYIEGGTIDAVKVFVLYVRRAARRRAKRTSHSRSDAPLSL
jgi:hypothetical protein